MSEKFKNLPVGCVVELSERTLKQYGCDVLILPIEVEINSASNGVYTTKTITRLGVDMIFTFNDIQRVISYPIDKERLKPGVKVKIREDLEVGDMVNGHVWYVQDDATKGKICVIHSYEEGVSFEYIVYCDENNRMGRFDSIMFEKIIEEPTVEFVDGVDALVAMKAGKYALCTNDDKAEWLIKMADNEIWGVNSDEEKPYEFERLRFTTMNAFLDDKYQIIDELPEWAVEDKNPFKVGQILIGDLEVPREVVEIISPIAIKVHYPCGSESVGNINTIPYREASPQEKAKYWEARAKFLESELKQ